MKAIRFGKDITLSVRGLKVGGEEYNPRRYTATVSVRDSAGSTYLLPTTYDSKTKTVTGKLSGTEQMTSNMGVGNYVVSVWLNYGMEGQTVVDFLNALVLVSDTSLEGGEDDTINAVDVTGEILSTGQSVSPATPVSDGLMSAGDKKKLDTLTPYPGFDTIVAESGQVTAGKTGESHNTLRVVGAGGITVTIKDVDGVPTMTIQGTLT